MRRIRTLPGTALAGIVAAVVIGATAIGCGPRDQGPRAPATERTGTHGSRRYKLRSEVEPPRVTVGDRALWTISAELTIGAQPGSLLRDSTSGALDLVPSEAPRAYRRENVTFWTARFEARGFDIGRIPLPRVALPLTLAGVNDTLEFPPDTLFVDSLTPAMTGAVEPDRGALPTELRPLDIIVAAVGALLVAAALLVGVWMLRRARRRAAVSHLEGEAAEAPEAIFLRSIAELRSGVETLRRDRFYDSLSLAIRRYVSAVTGVPALDRTTAELEREFSARADLQPDAIAAVARTLRRSDLAKFARLEDPLAEAAATLDDAAALSGRVVVLPAPASQAIQPPPAVPPPPPPARTEA